MASYLGKNKTFMILARDNAKMQEKAVTIGQTPTEIAPDLGYDGLSKVTIEAVASSIDENIKPENIRKGVTILGVTGTLEVTGDVEIGNADIYVYYNSASALMTEQAQTLAAYDFSNSYGGSKIVKMIDVKEMSDDALYQTCMAVEETGCPNVFFVEELTKGLENFLMAASEGNFIFTRQTVYDGYSSTYDRQYWFYFDEYSAREDAPRHDFANGVADTNYQLQYFTKYASPHYFDVFTPNFTGYGAEAHYNIASEDDVQSALDEASLLWGHRARNYIFDDCDDFAPLLELDTWDGQTEILSLLICGTLGENAKALLEQGTFEGGKALGAVVVAKTQYPSIGEEIFEKYYRGEAFDRNYLYPYTECVHLTKV